jgi:hypothetical protein
MVAGSAESRAERSDRATAGLGGPFHLIHGRGLSLLRSIIAMCFRLHRGRHADMTQGALAIHGCPAGPWSLIGLAPRPTPRPTPETCAVDVVGSGTVLAQRVHQRPMVRCSCWRMGQLTAATAAPAQITYMDTAAGTAVGLEYKRRFVAALNLRPGQTAIDVGCGPGIDLGRLADAVGVEGSAIGVDRARARCSRTLAVARPQPTTNAASARRSRPPSPATSRWTRRSSWPTRRCRGASTLRVGP